MSENQNIPGKTIEKENSKPAVNENAPQQQPVEQTETANQTSDISKSEFMEVHHHPKVENPAHGGTGKHFKEYFLEFLMIFLAVTLGFFAENIREHFTDARIEKEY